MKTITAQKEKVVYLGGKNEELCWGWVQFPRLYTMRNGNIGLSVHDDDDSWVSLDGDSTDKWFVSEDKGETWRPATKEDKDMMGTLLPNGDILRSLPNPPKSLKGVKEAPWHFANYHIPTDDLTPKTPDDSKQLPYPITTYMSIFEDKRKVYWLDTIPGELIEKRFCFHRLSKGEKVGKQVYAEVEWKHRTVISFPPSHATRTDLEPIMLANAGLYTCREVKVAPDNSLYIAHYRCNGANPFTGVYTGNDESYILRSTDNGESWQIHGYIPYQPDEEQDKLCYLKKGFVEPCIEFMPDGSMLCILRTCTVFMGAPEWGPTYLTRSLDGGKTWEKPTYFTDRGALPQLLQLKCGVTLAVITRPGIFVYASFDNGKTWPQKLEIMTDTDRSGLANVPPARANFHQYVGSCCNCTILPIAENKALLTFSDFYIPDDNGVKRKGIKTVEIVVK